MGCATPVTPGWRVETACQNTGIFFTNLQDESDAAPKRADILSDFRTDCQASYVDLPSWMPASACCTQRSAGWVVSRRIYLYPVAPGFDAEASTGSYCR